MTEELELTDDQVELLKTVPRLQEDVDDDTAKTFILACQELRDGYLAGAADDLEDVAQQLKGAADE